DQTTRRRLTGECHLADALVRGQGLARLGAEAVDDVEDSGREQITDEFGEDEDRRRGLLGRFEDDAVAGGERRGQLPGGHEQGEVPRNDLSDHAEGLLDRKSTRL